MIEHEYGLVIHHGGRTFFATETMGTIFEAAAADIVSRGDTELVPLLHRGGVDLLLIGPRVPLVVSRIEVGRAAPVPSAPASAVPSAPAASSVAAVAAVAPSSAAGPHRTAV